MLDDLSNLGSGEDKTYLTALQKVLESWPLYRKFSFDGGKVFLVPPQIRQYCPTCKGERNWQEERVASGSGAGLTGTPARSTPTSLIGYGQKTFTCRDCGNQKTTYFYHYFWQKDADSFLVKVGQYPPLETHPPAALAKNLDTDDAELYKKALISRNFNFGIGALAYLRRVVENKMNDLLNLIEDAAKQDGEVPEELKKIEDVKKSWRFDDKISYAARTLPARLKAEINPIDFLHDLASDGLHNKTDDECIAIFSRCKNAFEYVFTQLRVEIDDAKAYIATVKAVPDGQKPAD
jgi:hypothetical protein